MTLWHVCPTTKRPQVLVRDYAQGTEVVTPRRHEPVNDMIPPQAFHACPKCDLVVMEVGRE